jgi:3,4-dihydroxy-2-butanone 4-phosphate synthase
LFCISHSPLGTTTGISAADRALTLRALASSETRPSDFTRPGHVVPLRAHRGGIIARRGHTEAAVELCLATGLPPAGALCEIVSEGAYEWEDNYGQPGREGGGMARLSECRDFADRWDIKIISVGMLVEWRQKQKTPEMTSAL